MTINLGFRGKYIISGKLLLETGLRIGGATEGFEIGGVDNPVIRDPLTERPYIPGSSLKGKLRHLLEWSQGKVEKHPKHPGEVYTAHSCGECEPCLLFGPASDDHQVRMKAGPTRLTIRDAFPTGETVKEWEKWLGERTYTELKSENVLDRITSEATPRTMERVPAGSEFDFEMVFDVYKDDDKQLLAGLLSAMHLLENSALGGSGTRGYGKVKFADLKIIERSKEYYLSKANEVEHFISETSGKTVFPGKPVHHAFRKGLSGTIPYDQSLPKHVAGKLDEIIKG
jgi:CRISPR-associated protein Csm3